MLDPCDPAWIETYVSRCEDYLWSEKGEPYRRELIERRHLDEQVLRQNRVGADPGVNRMPRPHTLPQGGPGLVFPILDPTIPDDFGFIAVDCQKRLLTVAAGGTKYLNPRSELSRRQGWTTVQPADPGLLERGAVIVCEGMPDGYTAAQCNWQTVACLGTSRLASPEFARWMVDWYPDDLIVVATHQDPPNLKRWKHGPPTLGAGQSAVHKFGYHLQDAKRQLGGEWRYECKAAQLRLPPGDDLNSWMVNGTWKVIEDSSKPVEFAFTLDRTMKQLGWEPTIPEAQLPEMTRLDGSGDGGRFLLAAIDRDMARRPCFGDDR